MVNEIDADGNGDIDFDGKFCIRFIRWGLMPCQKWLKHFLLP